VVCGLSLIISGRSEFRISARRPVILRFFRGFPQSRWVNAYLTRSSYVIHSVSAIFVSSTPTTCTLDKGTLNNPWLIISELSVCSVTYSFFYVTTVQEWNIRRERMTLAYFVVPWDKTWRDSSGNGLPDHISAIDLNKTLPNMVSIFEDSKNTMCPDYEWSTCGPRDGCSPRPLFMRLI
jgi:hypothetical protein